MSFRADLHVHTDASPDGRSPLSALASAAAVRGLDAIAVTDHDLCTPVPARIGGVLLIPGCEISTRAGHVLGLFLEQPAALDALKTEDLPSAEDAVREIRRCGGLAVLAHPYESRSAAPDGAGTDAIETCNARATFHVKDANEKAAALAARLSLPATGGSDAHAAPEVGAAYTVLEAAVCTLPALRQALANGDCRAVLDRETPKRYKGLSQLAKARRSGGFRQCCVELVYLCYCTARDVLHL